MQKNGRTTLRAHFLEAGMCRLGGVGDVTPPIFSNLQESWSKGSHAAGDLATVFSMTFFLSNNSWSIGQNAILTEVVSAHHCFEDKT